MGTRTYTDDELARAVSRATSWRGVLRELGRSGTSGAAIRSVRRHAALLGLDIRHFSNGRRWNDEQLREVVADCRSWVEVARRLDLVGSSAVRGLQGHALRLGLATAHLSPESPGTAALPRPDPSRLGKAGPMIAGAWFLLSGYDVAWPLEPCRYDLLVSRASETQRIQVKTTNVPAGGDWAVWISTSGADRRTYGPDEIDAYFIIDGAMNYYLIPLEVVGGFQMINLAAYARFRLPQLRPA